MSSRSKEKVAAAFRKLFRGSRKLGSVDGAANHPAVGPVSDSPARRLLRHTVQPVDSAPVPGPELRTTVRSRSEGSGHPPKQVRTRRLMKEYKDLQRSLSDCKTRSPFTVELVNDSLYEWHVRLHEIDPESLLAADMREHSISDILLHVTFPDSYPFDPPFMRVVSPNIEKGYVMEGGAICMELLTPRGWASAYTIESVIMQFAASLVKGQGRIRKNVKNRKGFNQRAAEESFRSLVKTHDKYGWVTPPLSDG